MKVALIISLQLFSAFWPRATDTLKLFFIGDVMQHQAQLDAAYNGEGALNDPTSYNYQSYFRYIEPLYRDAHIVGANMESNFGPPPYSGYPTFCSPISLAEEAFSAGINLFFAANNHILDRGEVGLRSSIELYEKLGVDFCGVYRSEEEANQKSPLIIEREGFRVAILNYTYGTNGVKIPHPYQVNLLDSNRVKEELTRLREGEERVDLIIVSPHWGEEYHLTPSREQRAWERLFYSYGADLIVGHHPHVPQPVECYRDSSGTVERVTAYSLGNAISNMSSKNTRVGIALAIEVTKEYFTNKVEILEPKVHYIWATRPKKGSGNYSIVPMREALESPHLYPIEGEEQLIEHYYRVFNREKYQEINR